MLLERTEGWPAALRLAALSLSGEADPAAFVTAFAGDQHGVADYLMAEVLSRQSDDVRRFLVATSVAEKLIVDLAAALSGRADAGAILNRLERANALVTRLGPGRRWYRYHALLRSFLLAELRSRDVAASRRLHGIALRTLPWMLTTEEIAEAQVVSINTVKTRLRSIYRKLGVNSRRHAVEAARRAGIL